MAHLCRRLTKYIGVWLDPTLSFKTHINHTVQKVNCCVIRRSRNCFTYDVRKKLATQFIFLILDYCDIVYISASKCVLAPLTKLYNRICRCILNCLYYTHHRLVSSGFLTPSKTTDSLVSINI